MPLIGQLGRRDGRPSLALGGLCAAPGVELASVELVFAADAPFDAEALMAERGSLHRAEVILRHSAAAVLPGVSLHPDGDGPVLRWFLADGTPVTCRPIVCARPDGRPVVALDELRIHGPSAVAPPLAASGLFAGARRVVPGLSPVGPLHALLDLGDAVAAALVRGGFVEPDAAGIAVVGAQPRPDALHLVFRAAVQPDLLPLPDAFLFLEHIDRALAEGRSQEASDLAVAALRDGRDRGAAMTRISWAVAASPTEFPDAERVLGRFLSVSDGLPAALLAQASVHQARGELAAAADRLEALAAGSQCRPAERATALLAAARLAAEGGAHGRSAALLAEALQADASLTAALEALAALPDSVATPGRIGPVDATARLASEAADPARARLLHRALGLRLLAAGDPHRARRHLERALSLAPDDQDLEDALAVALLHAGQRPRAESLLAAVGRADALAALEAKAAALRERVAELPAIDDLPPMGDVEEADDFGPEADDDSLDLPEDPEVDEIQISIMSSREEAQASYPSLPVTGADSGVAEPTAIVEALELVGRVDAEGRRRLEALLEDPVRRHRLLAGLQGRSELPALLLSAEIHLLDEDPFSAEQALTAVIAERPDMVSALEQLARLQRARENWNGYVDSLTRQAGLAGDQGRWGDLLLEVARVRHEHMGERRPALATVNGVLQVFPDRPDALALRAELLEAEGQPVEALAVLRRALALEGFPGALRAGATERAARLADGLGEDPAEAAAWWAQIMAEAPEHPAALEAMQAHHRRRGDAVSELGLVDRRLGLVDTTADTDRAGRARSELLARRGALVRSVEGDDGRARQDLEAALQAWPENVDALEGLVDLLRGGGAPERLAELLGGLIELMLPGGARDALRAERDALLASA